MKFINYIKIGVSLLICTEQAMATYKYQSSCQVKNGAMQVHIETNDIGIDIYGDVKIKTFDSYSNTTRTSTIFLDTNISPYGLKTIAYEDVPSYVHRCKADFSAATVSPESNTTSNTTHIVVHERSAPETVIIHERRPSPRVSLDLHIPVGQLLFPTIRFHDHHRIRVKKRHHHKRIKVRKHHHHRRSRVRNKHKLVLF